MTPLGETIRALIAREGPITVERYMALCLSDPDHGYYPTRDPLGASGDFTTAPEISQIFGELLGLWAAAMWTDMGCPSLLRLVELGPGRGTLMADALRAARVLAPFRDALHVHLVETSPALRRAQEARLEDSGLPLSWHAELSEVPSGPAVILANEFFDALPVRQVIRRNGLWRDRVVTVTDESRLAFAEGTETEPAVTHSPPTPAEGAIVELAEAGSRIAEAIGRRVTTEGGAALVIDYGYAGPAAGETLQAVKGHRYADPLAEPGEADLTTQVDFSQIALAARAGGAEVHGLVTQRELLLRLGAEARAGRLRQRATPAQARAIDIGLRRLTAQGARSMGDLFKAVAITDPRLPTPAAFIEPYGHPRS